MGQSKNTWTSEIDATDGRPIEVMFPDGGVLRLRWDRGLGGVRVSAERTHNGLASTLGILPHAANCVILKVS